MMMLPILLVTFTSLVIGSKNDYQYEPRVVIECDHVPFYVDIKSGEWKIDEDGLKVCDHDKEAALRYCQKVYPNLSIGNIKTTFKPIQIEKPCRSGEQKCLESKSVVPYRCLVAGYESDTLTVHGDCKFNHIFDEDKCLSNNELITEAKIQCGDLRLHDFSLMSPCQVDKFRGIDAVCCSEKTIQDNAPIDSIEAARKLQENTFDKTKSFDFSKFLPEPVDDCNDTVYRDKLILIEKEHFAETFLLVKNWEKAESTFNELNLKDPEVAQEKIKNVLTELKKSLLNLENDFNTKKIKLRQKYDDCTRNQSMNHTKAAMLALKSVLQNDPKDTEEIERIIDSLMSFMEKDREETLQQLEYTTNEMKRTKLFKHLENLDGILNATIGIIIQISDDYQKIGWLKDKSSEKKPDHSHPELERIFEEYEYFFDVMEESLESKLGDQNVDFELNLMANQLHDIWDNNLHQPMSSDTNAELIKTDFSMTLSKLIAEFKKLEPVVPEGRCDNYEKNKAKLENDFRKEKKKLAQKYQQAEEDHRIGSVNGLDGEKKFLGKIGDLQKKLNALEKDFEQKEKRFWEENSDCFGIHILLQKRNAIRRYLSIFIVGFKTTNEVTDTFQSFLEAWQYEQVQLCLQKNSVFHEGSSQKQFSHTLAKAHELLNYLPLKEEKKLMLIKQLKKVGTKSTC